MAQPRPTTSSDASSFPALRGVPFGAAMNSGAAVAARLSGRTRRAWLASLAGAARKAALQGVLSLRGGAF